MGDQSQEPVATWLLSLYRTEREPSGRLIVSVASPLGPILGCAVPAAFGALVTLFFRAAGASALLVLFALVVIGVLAYNGSRVWICAPGTIQPSHAFWGARLRAGATHAARSVVLRRELWVRFHALAGAGTTLLVSSHVMDEAGQCDNLLLMREGRIVDLWIMRERNEGGVAVDTERRQRLVRPFGDHLHLGKPLDGCEGGARIDNGDVVAEKFCDRRQRLTDMHGTSNDQPWRRHVHGKKDLALRRLLHPAFGETDSFLDKS